MTKVIDSYAYLAEVQVVEDAEEAFAEILILEATQIEYGENTKQGIII